MFNYYFPFLIIFQCLFLSADAREAIHNMLVSAGVDSEELYLVRPLPYKEWDQLGIRYIRTTVEGKEKYKIVLLALEMLDKMSKIGYRVVGMARAKITIEQCEHDGLWWTLAKDVE